MHRALKWIFGRAEGSSSSPAAAFSDAAERDKHNKALGRLGEDAAVKKLVREGYRILERNYACKTGEVDIIAEHQGHTCFVEVKTRSPRAWNSPESAVTPEKQLRIIRASSYYLAGFRAPAPPRYDIVSVMADENNQVVSVELKKDAFVPVAG